MNGVPEPEEQVGAAGTFSEKQTVTRSAGQIGMIVQATFEMVSRALKHKSSTAVRENGLKRTQNAKIRSESLHDV